MERRTLLAISLSAAVWFLWMTFVVPPPPPPADGAPSATLSPAPGESGSTLVASPPEAGQPATEPASQGAPETVSLSAGVFSMSLSNQGNGPSEVVLDGFQERQSTGGLLTWLWRGISSGFRFDPLTPSAGGPVHLLSGGERAAVGTVVVGEAPGGFGAVRRESEGAVVFTRQVGDLLIEDRYEVSAGSYVTRMVTEVTNTSGRAWQGKVGVQIVEHDQGRGEDAVDQLQRVAYLEEKAEFEAVSGLDEENVISGPMRWFGLTSNYFLSGIVFGEDTDGTVRARSAGSSMVSVVFEPTEAIKLAPGAKVRLDRRLYVGPKELERLEDVGSGLEKAIDFGFFSMFAKPMLYLMRFFHGLVGSYGLAIILLTVVMKALTFPLTQKGMHSMQRMKEIQPEIQKLQAQFANNREQLNQEMMKLMAEKKVSPLGGCLPTLVQLPIWFALYRVLQSSIELYATPFLYLTDLSAADPYGLAPLLVGVLSYLQQRMTPTTGMDPAQAKMMQLMPIFFSFIMFGLPSGLVVYILVNSLLSILQQMAFLRYNKGAGAAAA